jgi:hypothetical protein
MRGLARGTAAGAAFGLLVFALEGALVLGEGAIGLNLRDTQGPFAQLFAAVRPLLPGLLARVALAYLLGGAALGLFAAALAQLIAHGSKVRLLFGVELIVLVIGAVSIRAVQRPALFDDLRWFQPLLSWAVLHGEPWHGQLFLGLWVAGHLAWWARGSVDRLRRVRWSRAVGAVGLGALGLLALGLPRRAGHPLMVLIGVDAFRPDRLVAYGGKGGVAPHLDQLAREATVFDRAFTPLAQTEPAWRSLLTARWPTATGVRYPLTAQSRWAPLPTFPAALEAAAIPTHWETDCSRFNHQGALSGFGERVQPPQGALNFALEKMRFRALGVVADNALGAALVPEFIDNRAVAGIYDPVGYARRLAARMLSLGKERPALFAWHATAAHFPGDPSWPFYRRYVRPDAPLDRKLRMVFTPIANGESLPKSDGWNRADSEALYDELLSQADAQVGVLLQALKDAGRYDEATIVVFSDHGESFHPDVEALGGATPVHGARLREEENRIMLLVKPAHGRQVERVGALVRLLDIGPTLLEWAKVAGLPDSDGQSLIGLLAGKAEPDRWLFAETGYTHASPAAFDAAHLAAAPRTFSAYEVRPDGVVQMSAAAHDGVMREKDFGAYDGTHWLVRSPQADGTLTEKCDGNCEALGAFVDRVLKQPLARLHEGAVR